MSKILYPVGTSVVVKASGDNSPFVVIDYKKGSKFPYRVSTSVGGSPTSVNGKTKFSVKGLKLYKPQEDQDSGSAEYATTPPQQPKETYRETYSKAEVDEALRSLIHDVYHDIGMIGQDQRNNMLEMAEMVDHNFTVMNKKIKSLSHNDD